MAFSSLQSDLETDLVNNIRLLLNNNVTSNGLSNKHYTQWDDIVDLPATVTASEGGKEVLPETNIYQYTITVSVVSEPEDEGNSNNWYRNTDHSARVKDVRNHIMYDDFKSDYNTGSNDAHILAVSWPDHVDKVDNGRVYRSEQTIEIIAAPRT